ncbi:MAG: hypothetical protein EHM17_03775, partial [Verrucomicrobiaceae bacterium]
MKHQPFEILLNRKPRDAMRRISMFGMAAAQAVFLSLGTAIATGQAEESAIDDQGAQVLTRGPVHEAFAGIVSYNPEPGVIVEKAPPDTIEELPPEVRPEGDNITWIPGYWGWDDERSDYLWISGTWRALPPGRQWTTGYWATSGEGYQWTSGYWADSSIQETTYLPRPPVTVEAGPNVAAPSRDYGWTPGNWMWQQERYAWRPGYWAQGRSDWDWIPAHYVWTPRGYVFVDGYWDYSFDRRGVLYAPVYFQSGYYSRPGYYYSPVIAIGLVALMDHLFLRPNYHHYYYGDYYDRRYRDSGYYSPYAYQSSRHGYDPVYSYQRWTHRQDQDWDRRYQESYDYRRDHESARPPRTWADQQRLITDSPEVTRNRLMMAAPLEELAKREDSPMRLQPVPNNEKEKLARLGREVRKTRDQRRSLEADGVNITTGKTEREIMPTKVRLPKSPIVGKAPDKLASKEAPPKRQQAPAAVEPKTRKPERQPDADKPRPEPRRQQEPRASERKVEQPKTERREAAPLEKKEQPPPSRREAEPQTKKQQAEPTRGAERPQRESRPEQQPEAREPERRTQPQPRQPERTAPVRPAENAKPQSGSKQTRESSKPPASGKSDSKKKDAEQAAE